MNKLLNIFVIFVALDMYNLSYKGIFLKSIHINLRKENINLDGNSAIIFGILTLLAGTYLIYLVLQSLFFNNTPNKSLDDE